MGLPDFPTDNLYKFMAISGFVLFVLSFGYVIIQGSNHEAALAQIEATTEAYAGLDTLEEEWLDNRGEAMNSAIRLLMGQVADTLGITELPKDGALNLPPIDSAMHKYLEEQLQALSTEQNAFMEEASEKMRSRIERALPSTQTLARLSAEVKSFKWALPYLHLAAFIGAVLSISGFYLWYTRVQKFQDEVLKRQAALSSATQEQG